MTITTAEQISLTSAENLVKRARGIMGRTYTNKQSPRQREQQESRRTPSATVINAAALADVFVSITPSRAYGPSVWKTPVSVKTTSRFAAQARHQTRLGAVLRRSLHTDTSGAKVCDKSVGLNAAAVFGRHETVARADHLFGCKRRCGSIHLLSDSFGASSVRIMGHIHTRART